MSFLRYCLSIADSTEFISERAGGREQCVEKIVDKEERSFQIKMLGFLEIAVIKKSTSQAQMSGGYRNMSSQGRLKEQTNNLFRNLKKYITSNSWHSDYSRKLNIQGMLKAISSFCV